MNIRAVLLAALYGAVLAQDSSSSSDSSTSTSSSSASSSTDSSSTDSSTSTSTSSSTDSSSTTSSSTSSSSTSSSSTSSSSTTDSSSSTTDSSSTTSSSSSSSSSSVAQSTTSLTAPYSVKVPTSNNNPFLDIETLPEGTLFIACGSILLGIFLTVVAWRVSETIATRKATKYSQERYQELDNTGPNLNRVEADYDLTIPGTFNASPQMFFSPTVNVMKNGSAGPMVSGAGASNTYLPAGYYSRQGAALDMPSSSLSSTMDVSISPNRSPGTSGPVNGPISGPVSGPASGAAQTVPKKRKQRPPSEFLSELVSK